MKIIVAGLFIFLHLGRACEWKFHPGVRDNSQGRLYTTVKNNESIDEVFFQQLFCDDPLFVLNHVNDTIELKDGESHTSLFILGISKTAVKKHPGKFEHKCMYSSRLKNSTKKEVSRCDIIIRTYLNASFLEHCKSYDKKDLVIDTTQSNIIMLKHEGERANYVANISCDPNINLISHGNVYSTLKDNQTWEIILAPNCSNVIDIDYKGKCRLSIYHMCQERGLVETYEYNYFEGNIGECIKKRAFNLRDLFEDAYIEKLSIFCLFLILSGFTLLLIKFLILIISNGFHEGCSMMHGELKVFCCHSNTNDYTDYAIVK